MDSNALTPWLTAAAAILGVLLGQILVQLFRVQERLTDLRREWAADVMTARRDALDAVDESKWISGFGIPLEYDLIPEPPHDLTLLDPKGANLVHTCVSAHTVMQREEYTEDLALGGDMVAVGSRGSLRIANRIDYAVSLWCRGSWRRTWIWFWLAIKVNKFRFQKFYRKHEHHVPMRPARHGKPPKPRPVRF